MTTWLSDAEREAWLPFIAVSEVMPGALNSQLRRDSSLDHFEYLVLAMLSEADDPGSLRLSDLASRTNSTLARLSHVVSRLEGQGLLKRVPAPGDRRATVATLTNTGWDRLKGAAPGYVAEVRRLVFDQLTPEDVASMRSISHKILRMLDPEGRLNAGKRPTAD